MLLKFDRYPVTLIFCIIWSIIAVILVFLNIYNPIRVILCIPIIIFIPGYLLVYALFPERTERVIDVVDRIALGIGVSIAIVPFFGIMLNYSRWGFNLQPLALSLETFILFIGTIAIIRWHQTPSEKRYTPKINIAIPKDETKFDKVLTTILVICVIITAGLITYVLLIPREGEHFTDFYILGPDHLAYNYPTNLTINEKNETVRTDPIPGGISSIITSYQWDDKGRFIDLIRLGISEYYLIAYQGENNDGYLRTIHVWNNNGSIQQIDTWKQDVTDGGYDSIVHVTGDVYAITYRNDTKIKVITVTVNDTNGNITKVAIDAQLLTYGGWECNMVHVNDAIYAIAYRNASDNDGWIETISIDNFGNISNSVIDSIKFSATDAYHPKMTMIDNDTVAIVYQGYNGDSYLITYNISSTGNITKTNASYWEFDPANGGTPNIIHINREVFAIAYNRAGDGQIKTLRIADTGIITKSWIDTLEFDAADAGYHYLFHIVNNVYGISYQNITGDGFLCTITIDNDGSISNTIIDSLKFNTSINAWYAPVIYISDDYFLIAYGTHRTNGNIGMILTVETDKNTMVVLGIVNHEKTIMTYTIEVWLSNQTTEFNISSNKNETIYHNFWFIDSINPTPLPPEPINLENVSESQWEYNYTINIAQFNLTQNRSYKLIFLLYTTPTQNFKQNTDYIDNNMIVTEKANTDQTIAYRSLYLWLSVQ